MKNRKNKKVVLASAIVLGITAITSSALAAYIITGGTIDKDSTVDNTDVTITNNVVDLQDPVITGKLLFYPEQLVSEGTVTTNQTGNLTINVKLTVKAATEGAIPPMQVVITATGDSTALSTGYITLPNGEDKAITSTVPIANNNFDGTEAEDGSLSDWTYTFDLKWNWGSALNKTDPATYVNTNTSTPTDASQKMNAFANAVNAIESFNLSFEKAPTE